jgi:Rps23 Pro-64 3,4-dihydroxylase Tpa1-like proline 4-hydroxylase
MAGTRLWNNELAGAVNRWVNANCVLVTHDEATTLEPGQHVCAVFAVDKQHSAIYHIQVLQTPVQKHQVAP